MGECFTCRDRNIRIFGSREVTGDTLNQNDVQETERIARFMADSSLFVKIITVASIIFSLLINLLIVGLFFWYIVTKSGVVFPQPWRQFKIDYEEDTFIMDGEPFRFVSGEFHYFRAPHQRWRNILKKMRAAGLNCISTPIEWSSHETAKDIYGFRGDYDIEHFLRLASEEDLYVILRVGPYINADRDFGGLPPWLLKVYPRVKIRTFDKFFIHAVENWFNELFPRLEDHFYGNGGPVIMVQVENEYGSFNKCDEEYKIWLRDKMKFYVGDAAVLFTVDKDDISLKCGSIPNVYATISFGTSDNADAKFAEMRNHSAHGPLVNSRLDIGWPCYWNEPRKVMDSAIVKKATLKLLDMNANFIYYMFFGGTNFYFKNGANIRTDKDGNKVYRSICTSYDYDAPLDESGDYTQKYWDILDALTEHGKLTVPDDFTPIATRNKGKYGLVTFNLTACIYHTREVISDKIEVYSEVPQSFEQIGLNYGYALYENSVRFARYSNIYYRPRDVELSPFFADKSYIVIFHPDTKEVNYKGILLRKEYDQKWEKIESFEGYTVKMLLENQGRISSGDMKDEKGLFVAPLFYGGLINRWFVMGLPFEDITWFRKIKTQNSTKPFFPAFYVGELVLPAQARPLDTYIDFSGWQEGSVFINNCSLGRFWPTVGPQITIFVPKSCLLVHPKKNLIVLFIPFKAIDDEPTIFFTDKPKWEVPEIDFSEICR